MIDEQRAEPTELGTFKVKGRSINDAKFWVDGHPIAYVESCTLKMKAGDMPKAQILVCTPRGIDFEMPDTEVSIVVNKIVDAQPQPPRWHSGARLFREVIALGFVVLLLIALFI